MKYVVRKIFPSPYESSVQVFDYEGLVRTIPFLLSCGIQNVRNSMTQPKSAVHVSVNGKRLTAEDLMKMQNDYQSFHVENKIEDSLVIIRGMPVPHSGKARYNNDRYEFRSKMVSRGQERTIEFRSDRKDKSWKKNSKARKSWGKHMNPGDLRQQHKFNRFIEEDQERLFMETWHPELCPWLFGDMTWEEWEMYTPSESFQEGAY